MKVELCPQCGSGKVTHVSAIAGDCRCDQCAWTGKERDLLVTEVHGSTLEMAMVVAQSFLLALTQEASIPVGHALFKSGLLPRNTDSHTVGRVLRATMVGACRAALSEIDVIQKELSDGLPNTGLS